MKNWQDYVDYQPRNPEVASDKPTKVIYLTCVFSEPNPDDSKSTIVRVQFLSEEIEDTAFIYDDDSIGDAVERTLLEFDEWTDYPEVRDEKSDFILVHRIKNRIAAQTRRGAGNTVFETDSKRVVMYVGQSKWPHPTGDSPIIVAERDGRYAIFKQPNFKNYGYIMETA